MARDFSVYRLDPEITEVAFMENIRRLAIEGGWLYYHTYDPKRSAPGFPDTVLLRPPDLIFAELKRNVIPGRIPPSASRLTIEQIKWGDMLRKIKAVTYVVWRPDQFADIAEMLLSGVPL